MENGNKNESGGAAPPKTKFLIKEQVVDIDEHRVQFLYVQIGETFLVRIGSPAKDQQQLANLSMAIGGLCTPVFFTDTADGNPLRQDEKHQELASKLSRRFNDNRPVYCSHSYWPAVTDPIGLGLKIEERLIQFVQRCRSEN